MSEPEDQRVPFPDEMHRAQALDDAITTMQSDRRAGAIDEGDDDALAMAVMLRTAHDVPKPDADFVAHLGARLEAQLFGSPAAALPPVPTSITRQPKGRSRRRLLTQGIAAAGGLAAGLVGGALIEQSRTPSTPDAWDTPLVGSTGAWLVIGKVSTIAPGAVIRFAASGVIGHLIRHADGSFSALSAACTHMGCIIAWNSSHDAFDCPCHDGQFDTAGKAVPGHFPYRPLPTIQTRVIDDEVSVFVPSSNTSEHPGEGYGQ